MTILHHTFTIERRYNHSPAKVFAAFADPVKKRRWFGGEADPTHAVKKHHGPTFTIDSHMLDFRIEGHERWRFHEGALLLTNDTIYLDIVPDRRIIFAYTMTANDVRFSSSHTTIELIPDGAGTKLVFTEYCAYFDGKKESAASREDGTNGLLDALGKEVETH